MTDSDDLWNEFLNSLYDDSLYKEEENEEEVNDPEYRVNEDIKQLYDEWDFKNVKVSDQELDLLFDEEENDVEVETIETAITSNIDNQTIDSNDFNKETVKILVTQIAEHIQLLTQTYLQTINNKTLETVAQNANSMLNEINDYSKFKTNSIFATINLKPSIELISNHTIEKCAKTTNSSTSWRSLPVSEKNQKIFTSNPSVFLYPWLLPNCGYYDITNSNRNKSKTVFTLAEDHLIALGLEQFTPLFSLRKCYSYIKQLLLPIKTVDQIRTHIKNIKRRSITSDLSENPIIYYSLNSKAPETHSGIIDPKMDTYLYRKILPEWYKKCIKSKITFQRKMSYESTNQMIGIQPKIKKFKNANDSQNDRKKNLINQSPVKQTNSIVKKYRYLNRINPLKQTLAVMSNTNSRSNKCLPNSSVTSSLIENLNISNEAMEEKKSVKETICPLIDDKDNPEFENSLISPKEDSISCSKNESLTCEENPSNEMNINEDNDNEKAMNENINEEDVEFDDESDLAALMTASSTIAAKNKIKSKNNNEMGNSSLLSFGHSKKEGRKSLALKQRESTLQLLSFDGYESDPNSEHKEELLVHYYIEKVRKSLSHENFVRFLSLLSEFDRKTIAPGFIKELYCQMEQFLSQLNVSKEIISEFVLFLSAEQAEECGKMFDYLYWKRFFNFVRKLEIYSSNVDPQCLQRLLRSLNQLKQNEENVDKAKIRSTVSRVLNGHSYLMHEFSSLFLDEKPSQHLFEDEDFDEIVIESSDEEMKNENIDRIYFENINIPESDDELKYGTNECPCKTCHTPSNSLQPIGRHCTSCSIRFIGGRVYLTQSHKKLYLAQIHYHDSDSQLNKGLMNNELNKQNEDEEEIHNESDNDVDIDSDSPQFAEKIIENTSEVRKWTISEDKMLLELCRSKVVEEKRNDLSEEIFEEAALKLSKDITDVIARFNQLMELFTSEQETSQDIEDIEV